MEIERKFLVKQLPSLDEYSSKYITQGYISTDPVIRIRQMDDSYFVSMKSLGNLEREKFKMPITQEQFEHLLTKVDSTFIKKRRYLIPLGYGEHAHLDVYEDCLDGLLTVEVKFESRVLADNFSPPSWFGQDITHDNRYKNNHLATYGIPAIREA